MHEFLNDYCKHQTWLITQDGIYESPCHHGAIAKNDARLLRQWIHKRQKGTKWQPAVDRNIHARDYLAQESHFAITPCVPIAE